MSDNKSPSLSCASLCRGCNHLANEGASDRLAQSMVNPIELYKLRDLGFLITLSLIEASSDQSCVRWISRSRIRARAETGD
jgi:hypothetical protein